MLWLQEEGFFMPSQILAFKRMDRKKGENKGLGFREGLLLLIKEKQQE